MELSLSWMAWTWPTAGFFAFVVLALIGMGLWEWRRPGGSPRRGILGLDTTRGDRLFITLLGAAFIHLGWLAAFGAPPWGALIVSAFFGIGVFRWV